LGQTAQEVFTYTVSDGQGGTAVADLVVTVTGTNDLPVIDAAASTLSGAVTEAGRADGGVPGASGQLVWSDPDAGAETRWSLATPADSRFGSFTVDAVTGEWAYVLDNSAAATQGLTAGQTETLTFDLRVTDEHGASAVTQVTVVVTGADDAAVITGPATGSVTEAGGRDNAAPGQPVTGGQLVVSDPDAGQSVFQTPDAGDLAGVYGQFSFNPATGVWSYALDNDRAATQALNAGETATETLVVTSADGLTSETITVTVTGSNDAATITGDVTGGVTEDDQPDTLTTTGSLTVTDPDAGQSLIAPGSLAFAGASHGGAGALGTLVIDAAGNWSYAIDNTLAAVQSLAEGASFTERWTVASLDGTASTTITVTVTGTNDDPVI
ncbi:VCBS domain-containing protein, partial [Szabonella alba]